MTQHGAAPRQGRRHPRSQSAGGRAASSQKCQPTRAGRRTRRTPPTGGRRGPGCRLSVPDQRPRRGKAPRRSKQPAIPASRPSALVGEDQGAGARAAVAQARDHDPAAQGPGLDARRRVPGAQAAPAAPSTASDVALHASSSSSAAPISFTAVVPVLQRWARRVPVALLLPPQAIACADAHETPVREDKQESPLMPDSLAVVARSSTQHLPCCYARARGVRRGRTWCTKGRAGRPPLRGPVAR
jgi:hypothetical protein